MATWALVAAGFAAAVAPGSEAVRLLVMAAAAVGVIALDGRSRVEQRVEARLGMPIREFWVPAVLAVAALAAGLLDWETLGRAAVGKADIVLFIVAFSAMAEGMRRSGIFAVVADVAVRRARGDTRKLIVYLFVASSALTYVTSNDVVVLAMTPVVFACASSAGIRDMRLLLLSQFVAANTVSMGLLAGSPTNLILGDALGVDFVSHAAMMAVPTVYAFMVTLLVVDAAAVREQRRGCPQSVDATSQNPLRRIPPAAAGVGAGMLLWGAGAVAVMAALAANTALRWPLYPTVAVVVLATWAAARADTAHVGPRRFRDMARAAPLGIVPFCVVFFAVAGRLARSSVVSQRAVPYLEHLATATTPAAETAVAGVVAVLTNILNDLPAAALTAETVAQADLDSRSGAVYTAAVTASNMGAYLTPVGALAGIVWFAMLKRLNGTRGDAETMTPRRFDLIRFGLVCFAAAAPAAILSRYIFTNVAELLGAGAGLSQRTAAVALLVAVAAVPVMVWRRWQSAAGAVHHIPQEPSDEQRPR